MNDPSATLSRILSQTRCIAVVGLSAKPSRPSHGVAAYLKAQGYRIVPVNPRYEQVLGERCYPRLEDVPVPVDLVDVFRRSEEVGPVADSAIAIGARCLWLQIGVVDAAAAARARAAGLEVVMDRCLKIDHARLFGAAGRR
mgnify:FL=1